MIKVGDLTLFTRLLAGEQAQFLNVITRNVRFTVNAPTEAQLMVIPLTDDGEVPDDADAMFLCTIKGLDDIEFFALGPFALSSDVDILLKTIDGSPIHTFTPEEATFTRIAERRPRNPEIERLQEMLLKNQERRMGAMYAEVERERYALARERETLHQSTSADGGSGEPPAPAPAVGPGEPAAGAGKDAKGTGGPENDA